jgi:ubiquinone/menaquinone biosynthesis C-methylase UbiE
MPNNDYVIDPDLMEEMQRLDVQGRLLTRAMGGLLAERPDFTGINRVLDLACGSGEWALEVAATYPAIQVVGVDKAPRMIEFARARAAADRLENARFRVVDITQPLPFPDTSFDLVNARLMQGFLATTSWAPLLRECYRLLRPGGLVRITENERQMTNSPAWEEMAVIATRSMQIAGKGFSPDGLHLGMFCMQRRLLEEAGFTHIQERAYPINISSGTEAHDSTCQEMLMAIRLGQPFILRMLPDYTQEHLDRLLERANEEAAAPSFCGIWLFLSASGEKPQEP